MLALKFVSAFVKASFVSARSAERRPISEGLIEQSRRADHEVRASYGRERRREKQRAAARPRFGSPLRRMSPHQSKVATIKEDASSARLSRSHRPCAQPRSALWHVLGRSR